MLLRQPEELQSQTYKSFVAERIRCVQEKRRKQLDKIILENDAALKAALAGQKGLKEDLASRGLNSQVLEDFDREQIPKRAKELDDIRKALAWKRESNSSIPDYVIERAAMLTKQTPGAMLQPQHAGMLAPASLPGMGWLGGSDVDIWPNNPDAKQAWAKMWGGGTGWKYGSAVQPLPTYLRWVYVYAPPESRNYQFTPHFSFRGVYIVRADDQAWNSKYAMVWAGSTYLNVWQSPDPGGEYDLDIGEVYGYDGDNIDMSGRLDFDIAPTATGFLEAGHAAIILAQAEFVVLANGDGSYAELAFSDDPGNYIACPFMHIS